MHSYGLDSSLSLRVLQNFDRLTYNGTLYMNRGMGPKRMFEDDIDADIARGNAAWSKIWDGEPFWNTNCFFNGSHTNA